MSYSKLLLESPSWCVPQIDSITILGHMRPTTISKHQRLKSGICQESKKFFIGNTLIVVLKMSQEQIKIGRSKRKSVFKKLPELSEIFCNARRENSCKRSYLANERLRKGFSLQLNYQSSIRTIKGFYEKWEKLPLCHL